MGKYVRAFTIIAKVKSYKLKTFRVKSSREGSVSSSWNVLRARVLHLLTSLESIGQVKHSNRNIPVLRDQK